MFLRSVDVLTAPMSCVVLLHCCGIVAGGTSVTGALECPATEKRMIVSLDTSQMVSNGFHCRSLDYCNTAEIVHVFVC